MQKTYRGFIWNDTYLTMKVNQTEMLQLGIGLVDWNTIIPVPSDLFSGQVCQ